MFLYQVCLSLVQYRLSGCLLLKTDSQPDSSKGVTMRASRCRSIPGPFCSTVIGGSLRVRSVSLFVPFLYLLLHSFWFYGWFLFLNRLHLKLLQIGFCKATSLAGIWMEVRFFSSSKLHLLLSSSPSCLKYSFSRQLLVKIPVSILSSYN